MYRGRGTKKEINEKRESKDQRNMFAFEKSINCLHLDISEKSFLKHLQGPENILLLGWCRNNVEQSRITILFI